MNNKVIQIIPAPVNMFYEYEDEGIKYSEPVVCLGLTSDGDVLPLGMCADGIKHDVSELPNLTRVYFK